jgi:hypothetical protein
MLRFKEKGVSREYATENEWLEDIFTGLTAMVQKQMLKLH